MENAEEVMQLLEDFSKIRPKEIPPELEDYLGYVAATGDPVFQWTLVKNLFREKLLCVITDFFESTLTVELPPCPNVEPFNYERMKTSLLERLDTFTSAPFTVQRICELLTNPRKEYNRADKYMRAIEKNILVVSTREPGSGKRPLESDGQQETILNGMPDLKLNVSDGSLLHVPTDLPYLGAPPASNDVTIETTDANISVKIEDTDANISIKIERSEANSDGDNRPIQTIQIKSEVETPIRLVTEPMPRPTNPETEPGTTLSSCNDNLLNIETVNSTDATFDCDTNDKVSSLDDVSNKLKSSASDMSPGTSSSELPDSIDSTDALSITSGKPQSGSEILEYQEAVSMSDENEVSSTPAETSQDGTVYSAEEELVEPADSEAEATDSSGLDLDSDNSSKLGIHSVVTAETSCIEKRDEIKSITIAEISATKSDDESPECNEIKGTVVSPISPDNNSLSQTDDTVKENLIDEIDQGDLHPDSSNDACIRKKESVLSIALESDDKNLLDSSSEADPISESRPKTSSFLSTEIHSESLETVPDQTVNEGLSIESENSERVSSPVLIQSTEKNIPDNNLPMSSNVGLSDEDEVSEVQSTIALPQETIKIQEVQSTVDTAPEKMFNEDKREESVIHSLPQESVNVHKEMLTSEEEISMDPNCQAEEAMDVDDTSNQMMVSEGENEIEPMDESDQIHS